MQTDGAAVLKERLPKEVRLNGTCSSGGASAVKEPGHFEVRKSSSQVRSPGVPDAAKGSPDPVAYRSKAIGRAEPGRLIFQPGHLTWFAVV